MSPRALPWQRAFVALRNKANGIVDTVPRERSPRLAYRFQNSASSSPFPLITPDCAPGSARSDRPRCQHSWRDLRMLTFNDSTDYCSYFHTASVNKAPIVELTGRCSVRAGVGVGRVRSKRFTQKSQSSKSKKAKGVRRKTARRSAGFKSDSWYAGAALSIGIRARPKSHRARAEHPAN